MRKGRFPKGWDKERVQKVIAHYEKQTEEESMAEDEAAYEDKTSAIIEVPVQLLSAVRKLITQYQISHLPKTIIKR